MLLQCVAAFFAADFLSGLFHWLEDSYFSDDAWLIGPIIRANSRHHEEPTHMTRFPWYKTVLTTLIFVLPLALLAPFSVPWLLFWVLAAFSNQLHKWTHMVAPTPIRWLQRIYLLNSPAHHNKHHRWPRDSHYCIVHGHLLNPFLDAIGFWAFLERTVFLVTGVKAHRK